MRPGIIFVLVTGTVTSVWPAARDATVTPGTGWTGKDRVQAAVKVRAEPFRLQDVRLLTGPFRHAQELNRK